MSRSTNMLVAGVTVVSIPHLWPLSCDIYLVCLSQLYCPESPEQSTTPANHKWWSFTTILECSIHQDHTVDVSLGLDWTAGVREWLKLIGLGLAPSFDLISGLISVVQPGESLNRIYASSLLTGSY
jgi:hypothetical protein